jgi:hypothetical protein
MIAIPPGASAAGSAPEEEGSPVNFPTKELIGESKMREGLMRRIAPEALQRLAKILSCTRTDMVEELAWFHSDMNINLKRGG